MFKARAARAALKGSRPPTSWPRSAAPTHPNHDWKRQLLAGAEQAFGDGVKADTAADAEA